MTHNGYAVIDFETTGLWPQRHDRIIEIGVVHVSPTGVIEREFETVVHPNRDLGPTHVHGLRGADMRDAPAFADIAADFLSLLDGRVVVAHNARFEATFIRAELQRAGLASPLSDDGALCTMTLASQFLPGSGRKLADCCAAYDIELVDAHEALSDARATAQLLAAYIADSETPAWWEQWGDFASAMPWPTAQLTQHTRAAWVPRRRTASHAENAARPTLETPMALAFLDDATNHLPALDLAPEHDLYAATVDRALSDGYLSVVEADELHDLAITLGLSVDDRTSLHRRYFDALVEAAWADNVLTGPEVKQIEAVARMLDIDDTVRLRALEPQKSTEAKDPALASPATALSLDESSVVVLTGELWMPREDIELLLMTRGVVVKAAVSKKVTLVIAADPDSLSGKARKARQYGIPLIDGDSLRALLSV